MVRSSGPLDSFNFQDERGAAPFKKVAARTLPTPEEPRSRVHLTVYAVSREQTLETETSLTSKRVQFESF